MPIKTQVKAGSEYDYIICGGGTSGCVIAGRLAEHFASSSAPPSILVIEAGPHNEGIAASAMPGGVFQLMGAETDWKIETVPQKHLNNRILPLSRGKMLGGSSCSNGTLCIRGHKKDYDEWELEGWSGDEMFEYMNKAETFHEKPFFAAKSTDHGSSGPLHIEPREITPISKLLLESMQSKGLPLIDDLLTTGEGANGCGSALRSVHDGVRTTAADFVKQHLDRIDVLVSTMVDKVNVEDWSGELCATSVDVVGETTKTTTIRAKKEVIVSGGTYLSPAILQRSGIGAATELAKHDIECKVDLPGVGKNLIDHLVCFASYEIEKPDLTRDSKIHHEGALAESMKEYQESHTGALSDVAFGAFAFARLDDRLKDEPVWRDAPRKPGVDPVEMFPEQAHIEYMHFDLFTGLVLPVPDPKDKRSGLDLLTGLFSQQSKGTVQLRSKEPFDNPLVDPHYMEEELDMLVMSEGVRFGNEIMMDGKGTKGIAKGPPGTEYTSYKKREDWIEHVRNYCQTCYHPVGTCKMGREDDPMAVVDKGLKVRGVKGLRVADCSIMPTLNGGHTQMPAYAIGEKAAEMLMEDWKN